MNKSINRVTCGIVIGNICAAILILGFCLFLQFYTDGLWWGELMIAAGLVQAIMLILGVLFMRKQINYIGGIMSRDKLVIVHLINFLVWSTLFIAQNIQAMRINSVGYDLTED